MAQRVMAGAFGGIMSDAILQRRTKAADVVLCVFGLGLGVGLVYYGNTADRYELVGSLRVYDIVGINYKAIVSKPDITEEYEAGCEEFFDPWQDLFPNISGGYANTMDILFVTGLKAVRDRKTYEFFELSSCTDAGFAAEMVMYIFDGHGITDCGTSPRGAWPSEDIKPYLDEIIRKWEHYYTIVWGDEK